MTGAREQILGGIRGGLRRGELAGDARKAAERRLAEHPRNLIPARGQLPHLRQVDLFVEMVEALSATVARVPGAEQVPEAVGDWLVHNNLAQDVRMSSDPWLEGLPWERRPLLSRRAGPAEATDAASLTLAFAGIAETGTLMLTSDAQRPTTLNFLPDNHIVVLRASQVVGDYESAWARLRAAHQDGSWPRTVNMVTGPSRTADIEQMVILGAHGPRRLHIVLVEDGETPP